MDEPKFDRCVLSPKQAQSPYVARAVKYLNFVLTEITSKKVFMVKFNSLQVDSVWGMSLKVVNADV